MQAGVNDSGVVEFFRNDAVEPNNFGPSRLYTLHTLWLNGGFF